MELTVLQWNVWYRETADNVLRGLKDIDADVLCLQELTQTSDTNPGIDIPAKISQELGYQPAFYEAQAWRHNGQLLRNQGNGIFSKFPITSSFVKFMQQPGGADPAFDDEGRTYVEATLDVQGTPFTVATAHMSYTHKFEPSAKRTAEEDNLVSFIGQQRQNYVFTADLNAPPTVDFISRLPRATNLKAAGPPYTENTWTTKPFAYENFIETNLAWRLDYAFGSPDVEIIKAEILQTGVSDHLPILLTIKLG